MCVCVSYYEDIQKMPTISEQDMHIVLKEECQVDCSIVIFITFVQFVFYAADLPRVGPGKFPLIHSDQGRRHGVNWGGHVHPTFARGRS